MVWASASLNAYVGYSRDGITWNYLKAQASHALSSGSLLEASNEADAQENYWTTGISGDGQLADALWPYMRQAKICRLYFSTTPVTIHELKFWVYVIADEIVAGTLRLATGLTIASTQDPNNAVIMDSSGIRAYAGSVQKLNITPAGITITAGSGYANLSDKPTSLSGINSGEGTKLSGIAAGATVGADWSTNLVNIPGTLVSPSGDGLYLGATYMGFYKSSAWKSFMKNDGTFQFYGDASNYVAWNGSALTVRGSLNADDISAGTITGRTLQTAASGQRFVVSASDTRAHFYADRGDAVIGEIASIGNTTVGSYTAVGVFGSMISGFSASGVYGLSYAGNGVIGITQTGVGIYGIAVGDSAFGGAFSGGYGIHTVGLKSPIRLVPDSSAAGPTHTALNGSFWVTSLGKLCINTDSGTTWSYCAYQRSGNYVGDNTTNRAIAHGLGYMPRWVMIQRSDGFVMFQVNGPGFTCEASAAPYSTVAITNMNGTYFYVGNPANYTSTGNGSGLTYYWVASG